MEHAVPDPNFYITGGTILPDAPSYIARQADKELLDALCRGEICYVLNARQMGKSSMCVRTRAALEREGVCTSFLDLQKFGSSATPEQWYRSLLERAGHDLKLRASFLAYWRDNAERTPIDRFFGALREVALEQLSGEIVIFLDEIDVVRDLDFKTDEFFAAIRQCHNERAQDAAFRRLTFCIIGTVAPTDLIRDVRLSPFNIGTRVKLADFTPAEAAPLAAELPGDLATLDRILWWTAGHPYLTQRLCSELSKAGSRDVDETVARLFLAKSDSDVDENVKNVRNGLLRMGGEGADFDRVDLLQRYGQIVASKRVPDDDTDAVCTALRLSGLVRSERGLLHVRNRVYAKLFDGAWVQANLPDAELRRQRAARMRGFLTAAIPSLIALTIVSAALIFANVRAQSERNANRIAQTAKQKSGALAELNGKLYETLKDRNSDMNSKNKALEKAVKAQKRSLSETKASKQKSENLAINLRDKNKALLSAITAQKRSLSEIKAEKQKSENLATTSRNLTFGAIMNLIQSLADSHPDGVRIGELLEQIPKNQRHFEWNYWKKAFPKIKSLDLKGHTGDVSTVALSQDGRTVVTGSWDHTARIWDARTGETTLVLKEYSGPAYSVALSGWQHDRSRV